MKKIKDIYNKVGLKGLIKRIIDKFLKVIGLKENVYYNKKKINEIFEGNYKRVIIFENHFGWNQIMRQRPQQIALNFQSDTLFIYGTPYEEFYNIYQIDQLKSNVYLINLDKYRKIIQKKAFSYKKKYLMLYSSDYIDNEIIDTYKKDNYGIIYEYVDKIDKKLCSPVYYESLLIRRKEMLTKNNYIICTATSIVEDAKSVNKEVNVKLITNGADYNHFHKESGKKIGILEKYKDKTIIGYYGALADWVNYDLLKEVANDKDNIILLCGVDFDGSLANSGLLKYKNVKYLGKIDYNDLVDYALYFDICIIPFLINDITRSTSPVKLFEYMSLGKPIVTTELPECKKYKSIFVSKDNKEFIDNINKVKKLKNDNKYLTILDKEARNNSWHNKCKNIVNFLDKKPIKINYTPYYIIRKTYRFLKWHLLVKPFSPLKKIIKNKIKIINQKKYNLELNEAFNGDYDRIVLWINNYFGWDTGLFQRPQHIAINMAKNRTLYFYDASNEYDGCPSLKKQAENLYLVNTANEAFLNVLLNRIKKTKKPKYLNIYSTEMLISLSRLKKLKKYGFKILYEYIDDLSPAISGTETLPKNILDKYNYCMNDKEDSYVVVTADNIEKDVLRFRNKEQMTYSCNGVDYNHFQVDKNIHKVNNQMKKIIRKGKPIIGYYGALATWFDYDLIKHLAIMNKNCEIVLIGVEYDHSYKRQHLDKYNNIHFLGTIPYKELPYYAKFFDTCMIPFVINDITEATSPLKLFEYMALHKPIITTAMHECKKYKSVMIANTKEEFIELVNKSFNMTEEKDKEYFDLLQKEALDNSWSKKCKIILDYISKYEKKGDRYYDKNQSN